jgi:hypothetical protein
MISDPRDDDSGTDSEAEKIEEIPEETLPSTQIVDGSANPDGSNSAPQCWGMLNCKTGMF